MNRVQEELGASRAGADVPGSANPPQPEPPYALIRDGLRDGKVIPFLGAGASMFHRTEESTWASPEDDFLPSASELASYLDDRSGFPSAEAAELARVAQYFDGIAGRGFAEPFRRRSRSRTVRRPGKASDTGK